MQTLLGKTQVSVSQIKNLPSFIGVPDVIKSLSTLPGIVNGKEGFSNLYVRGGTQGQNLILMDGTPFFSSNHAVGLISAINVDALQNIDLYKSGFPARYGNCSSSILDIQLKEGDFNRRKYKVEIGTLTSGFLAEGPIKSEKTSFLVAGRTSYFDIINIPKYIKYLDTIVYKEDLEHGGINYLSMNAFDLNTKITHKFDDKNKIFINVFTSNDFFNSKNISTLSKNMNGYTLNNFLVAIGSRNFVKSNFILSTNLNFSYSNNKFFDINEEYGEVEEIDNFSKRSSISYYCIKSQADYFVSNSLFVKGGIESSLIETMPNTESVTRRYGLTVWEDTVWGHQSYTAHEHALFTELEFKPTSTLSVNLGFRSSIYLTDSYTNFSLEPRLSIRRMITEKSSVKFNYTSNSQNIHLILRNLAGQQDQYWLLSNKVLKPEKVHQVSLGYFGIYREFEYGLECFYKKMAHLIEYRNNHNIDNDAYKNIVSNGEGTAYGIETNIERNINRTNTKLSYTLSWSDRKFSDLNNGRPFPFTYSYRHVASFVTSFPLFENWFLTTSFIFMSGQPFTLTDGYFKGNESFGPYDLYSGINSYKLPPYHRMDVLFVKKWTSAKGYEKNFKISIYNVYNRRNAVFAYVQNGKVVLMSIFGIIPTISYGIAF
jgi:hypothetical protein